MVLAVILVLSAAATCVAWRTLTPGVGTGDGHQPTRSPDLSQESVGPRGCTHDREPHGPVGLWGPPGGHIEP